MEITCPQCAAQGTIRGYQPGREIRCPRCRHGWVPDAGAMGFRLAEANAPSMERWLSAWTLAAGIGLIVGFVLPIVLETSRGYYYDYRSQWETIWFWDLLDHSSGGQALGILLPVLVGIAALIVRGTMRGRPRAITVFSIGAGALLLSILLTAEISVFRGRSLFYGIRGGGAAIGVLILLSASAVAVGNRIRKHHATALLPRLLAGIGGCVLVLMFLIPHRRHSLIEAFFEGDFWEHGWAMLLIFLTLMAYGIVAIFHFGPRRSRTGLCRAVSTLGRVVIIGAPVAVLISILVATDGEGFGSGFLLAVKLSLLGYGSLALLGVGLTAWLSSVIGTGRARPAAAPAVAPAPGEAPAAPPGDLKTRLERLKSALEDGLLTPEEYEAKRKKIVDSAEF